MFTKKILSKTFSFLQVNASHLNSSKLFRNLQKFNFSRKVSKDKKISQDSSEASQNESTPLKDEKTINIIREDLPIKINPYFSKAVSERQKSATNVTITSVSGNAKKQSFREDLSADQKEEVIKTKQKLAAARKQKSKTIGVIVENIKRELPKEL